MEGLDNGFVRAVRTGYISRFPKTLRCGRVRSGEGGGEIPRRGQNPINTVDKQVLPCGGVDNGDVLPERINSYFKNVSVREKKEDRPEGKEMN